MSKCREAFEKHTRWGEFYPLWQAAWNARGKVDAAICRFPVYIEDQEQYYGNLMAEAIEKEQA